MVGGRGFIECIEEKHCQNENILYLCIVICIREITSKSKHLFPKRDACFFIFSSYRGGTTTRTVVLSFSRLIYI